MADIFDDLILSAIELRRLLHRKPEITWSEYNTARIIRERLDALGINWRQCAKTGTVATIGANMSGRHVAFRADMDALPMEELTRLPWASQVHGCMHACGHDGHVAVAIALAGWLKNHETELPGPVSFLFQPAEEGGHGARQMIKDGALKDVDAVFGWHNWPAVEFNKAICPDGTIMAANAIFSITVSGRGGHASQPELCRDPVLAASAIIMAMQQITSRRLPPQHAGVVSVTSIDTPQGDTTIPDKVVLGGSIRIDDTALREEMGNQITAIARDTALSYNVSAETLFKPRYSTVDNHSDKAESFRRAIADEFGPDWLSRSTPIPIMASEDFSYYLEEIPGAFAIIGANDGENLCHPCHSAYYDFNDNLIRHVVRIFSRLAGIDVT
ncbi:MAG: N(2)-acetyl-L-2,4-diaminobutanoate deacetylase DoeB2 [Thermodesulfobacteriota bacterium]|nr:N(2)-acetyl-L-2,4-diaminobutanoate deacetylase DoeB2 [Thermodesulfobacteriota bacterium]